MSNTNHAEVSKFLSYVLRHKPEAIELTLNSEGWANIAELISGAAKDGRLLTREMIQSVVDNSNKKRFSISPDRLSICSGIVNLATTRNQFSQRGAIYGI